MSFIYKIGLGVAAVAVLASLLTVALLDRSPADREWAPPTIRVPDSDAPALTFPVTVVQASSPLVVELGRPAHYHFWFENRHDVALQFTMHYGSCKCLDALSCTLNPEEAHRYRACCAKLVAQRLAGASAGLLWFCAQLHVERQRWHSPEWTILDIDEPKVVVAPHHAGLLRLSLVNVGTKLGPGRVAVGIASRATDASNAAWSVQRLELAYLQVAAPQQSSTEHPTQ